MQITKEQREQYISDMKSLIQDNKKEKKKFPSNEEFAELCEISVGCVKNYRKKIVQRDKELLLDRFEMEIISSVDDNLTTLYDNIEWYETLQKDEEQTIDIRMSAAKLIEEARKNITQIMIDSPEIFGDIKKVDETNDSNYDDNVLLTKEHLHRTEERITEGLNSLS